ncbi:unnamed protein product, partial [marine sediment metagenome]
PCSGDVWKELKHFDRSKLPKIMKQHPYYNLEKI